MPINCNKNNTMGGDVTNVTKRNIGNKLKLDSKRNNVTSPPFRGDVCYACPGRLKP